MTHDTIAAIATAPGQGGVSIVRISGTEAEQVLLPHYFIQRPRAHPHRQGAARTLPAVIADGGSRPAAVVLVVFAGAGVIVIVAAEQITHTPRLRVP